MTVKRSDTTLTPGDTQAPDPLAFRYGHATIERRPSIHRYPLQDRIHECRPSQAIAAAQIAAPETMLDDPLTASTVHAVLGVITDHPHALHWNGRQNERAEHETIVRQLLTGTASAYQATLNHPGHAAALDLAAGAAGLTTLFGLVYGWTIRLFTYTDTGEHQLDVVTCDDSWTAAESAAKQLLAARDIDSGRVEVSTATWGATTIYV